ncbi:hypothetical protein RHMOL_Rhmol04G0103100 [Rhododendron molle]|uniref:Uncharacterized protein n=1 Tax=Rhododendron molle TaxID=49168 RepID=A0ACC0P045_RHOML|nr:hypothetical protein RHMOL_Rhmol04G0103100 [Rhododendron molle]
MMVRSSKVHGEKSNDTDYLEGKDWISNLPDAILCHILSLMPTKNAVRTRILSTRWKSLWASVPIIDLRNYRKDDGPGSFMDFVDRVLLLHNSPNLTKFLLHSGCGDENPYRLNSWISTAIKRHVQELVLSITSETIFELPRHLFTSIDLVVLKLSYGFSWSALTVSLPRLKVLRLWFLDFLDDAPSLETLELEDELSSVFEVDELPALVKANFSVWFHGDDYEGSDCHCNAVVRMLAKASNVQHLWLDDTTLKDRKCCDMCLWGGAPVNVPICLSLSLEKLEFRGFSGCNKEMKLVQYLLENAMVLKKLTLYSWSRNKKIKTDLQKYKRGSSTCQIEFRHQFSVEWL